MTYEAVVLAANGLGAARGASDTDGGDGRASDTDKRGQVRNDDAEEAQEQRGGAGACLYYRSAH